ncbi:tetratricopeptide repeat protein [Vulgatibacter incomptus]|uniref:TPR domain protein, putative n=1 Tax=Vulgatibacter incomptus TaxID=1391653 RepID=A0A0K1P9W6_9BACT|nr:tetratricopeptide repeat protein [Vulgatibacter incomptus]AKU90328.1 TPR domain protein, putative [Vulgatibacter incomptus]
MDKNKVIQAATKLVQKGQLDKAIAEYEKVRKADPKDVRILLKIGELQQKKGENVEAARTLLDAAKSYASDGFFLKAVAVYKQIVKLDPSRIDVNLQLAELYQQLGLMTDAMTQLQQVANHQERGGQPEVALETLRRMVDLDPENVGSRIKLGELFAQQGKTEDGLRELRLAAEHLKSHNRLDDYLRVAERVATLAPEDLALSRELAGCSSRGGIPTGRSPACR